MTFFFAPVESCCLRLVNLLTHDENGLRRCGLSSDDCIDTLAAAVVYIDGPSPQC